MDRYAFSGQERPEGLGQVERGRLRDGVGGEDPQPSQRGQGHVVDDGPWERRSSGKKARVTLSVPKRSTDRCCSMVSRLLRSP